MNTPLVKFFSAAAAGCALTLSVSSAAHAQTIIYQDTFSRTGMLAATSPDVDTTAATWIANTVPQTTGSAATSTSAQAFLPFTLQTGAVYSLSATLTATSGDWVALGFSQTTTPGAAWHTSGNNVGPWMLFKSGGNEVQLFGGTNTNNGVGTGAGSTGIGTQGTTYTVSLNTTTPQWTYSFSGAGITTTTYTFATNPTGIADVGFGTASGGSGTFDNFTLTSTVPEPSTYLLLGMGLATLLIVARRGSLSQA